MGPKSKSAKEDKEPENSGQAFQDDLNELYGEPEDTSDDDEQSKGKQED